VKEGNPSRSTPFGGFRCFLALLTSTVETGMVAVKMCDIFKITSNR
jgi:hypothetical protein